LLFMGEEYGETAPFLYFSDSSDEELVNSIREGRKREFAALMANGEPVDPFSDETYQRSKLNHALAEEGPHHQLREFYRTLIHLRKTLPALQLLSKENSDVHAFDEEHILLLHRWYGMEHAVALFNFDPRPCELFLPIAPGKWHKLTDSELGQSDFPNKFTSKGKVRMRLPAECFALYGLQSQYQNVGAEQSS